MLWSWKKKFVKNCERKKPFYEGPRPGSNHTPPGPPTPRPRYSGSTRPRPSRWATIRVQMATGSQKLFPNFCQMQGRKWVIWSTYIAGAVPLKKPKKNNSPERAKNTILLFLHSSSLGIHQASPLHFHVWHFKGTKISWILLPVLVYLPHIISLLFGFASGYLFNTLDQIWSNI